MELNNFCSFVEIDIDTYQCTKCGTVVTNTYDSMTPLLLCSMADDAEMAEIQKLDLACSISQIKARFAICEQCEFFKNNTCDKCGCRIQSALNFKNKLIWKDQQCPVGKWGPESSS